MPFTEDEIQRAAQSIWESNREKQRGSVKVELLYSTVVEGEIVNAIRKSGPSVVNHYEIVVTPMEEGHKVRVYRASEIPALIEACEAIAADTTKEALRASAQPERSSYEAKYAQKPAPSIMTPQHILDAMGYAKAAVSPPEKEKKDENSD